MSNRRRPTNALAACAALVLAATPTWAQMNPMDIQVAGRVLSFLEKPLTGEVTVGIVYSHNNAQSLQDAQDLEKKLGSGLRVGNLTLKPVLVAAGDAARANVSMFFVTPGTGADAAPLVDITRAKHVPCVTTDLSQVTAGRCAVGVKSVPKIEIVVNRSAAAASGTAFSTVFRMMITEI